MKKICPKHGEYEVEYYSFGLKREKMCPLCNAEIEKENEKLMKEEEAQKKKERYKGGMISRGIPFRYWKKGLDDLEAKTSEQSKIYHVIDDYVNNQKDVTENGRCLILYGKVGTGKTHIATSIVKSWKGSSFYIGARNYTRTIRDTYSTKESENSVIKRFSSYDLLAIDEIGKQFSTDAERFAMFDLINQRYNDVKPTIIVTNMKMKELKEFLGEDTVDRLKEGGGSALLFSWDSFRERDEKSCQKIKENENGKN